MLNLNAPNLNPLVYIAAPYQSDPVCNVRAATTVGMKLWRTGLVTPVIPHLSMLADLVYPMSRPNWLQYDLDLLMHNHAVYRLMGESEGADREVELAREMGLPVFEGTGDAGRLLEWAGDWTVDAARVVGT